MIGTFRQVSDATKKKIQKVITNKEIFVIFSAFEAVSQDTFKGYRLNIEDKICDGKVKFAVLWTPWDDGKSEIWYESDVIENPTYLDAAVCANDMIHKTGDEHHVFLEEVLECGKVNGIKILSYYMGS